MKNKNTTTERRERAFQEALLAELGRQLATPSADWPNKHCWTETKLKNLIKALRTELEKHGLSSSLTCSAIIDWLGRLGLAKDIRAEGETFYLMDLGGDAEARVDPYELLMATKPSGVICYFSAIAFHSLTTHPVTHHHVAQLREGAPSAGKRTEPPGNERIVGPSVPWKPQKLGTLLFRYQETPFYFTNRSDRLVPGVQLRGHGPRTQLRITTLEQTLLDTLFKPFHSGGPEVAFESWREAVGSGRVDEERMADYLTRMKYPATTRRVGAMFTLLGHKPSLILQKMLESTRILIDRQAPYARISLLPGVNYTHLDEEWLVSVP